MLEAQRVAMRGPRPDVSAILVAVTLVAVVALGVTLRLKDPLSTDAIAAEDPYTHVVFTKEALARGAFGDSVHLGTTMYPPGIHAFAGAIAAWSGVSLYDIARISPALFGGLAIVGMYALAARLGGRAAGLTAAIVTAVMPEHVFRTELFFPTALDLALLPAWILLFVLASRRGAWGASAAFVALGVPFAFLHPWAVVLFAVPLALFVALRATRGGDAPGRRDDLAWSLGLLVLVSAFAMASRWRESGTGFADFFAHLPLLSLLARIELHPFVLFAVLVPLGALAAAASVAIIEAVGAVVRRAPRSARGIAAATAGALLVVGALVLSRGLPADVHYLNMLGTVPAILALVGVVVACLRPRALGDVALALVVVLFPLTALDVFDSPYWPQRTVAYLSVGVALLAATVAMAAQEWMAGAVQARSRSPGLARWATPLALVVVLAGVGGALASRPPEPYTWYRLYPDAQFDGFEVTADLLARDPDARAVVYSWQPGLMLKALADPAQVRYAPDFYKDGGKRGAVLGETEGTTYVVVDRFVLEAAEKGKADLGFVHGYRKIHSSSDGRFVLYLAEGGR